MKKKIKYTNEPMEYEIVDDFLPSPDQLAVKEENVKVTISLSKNSVKFFKEIAKRKHSHYQTMIRKIIDYYASHYKKSA